MARAYVIRATSLEYIAAITLGLVGISWAKILNRIGY